MYRCGRTDGTREGGFWGGGVEIVSLQERPNKNYPNVPTQRTNLQNKETLLIPEIPTKVGHNAENLERSELARNAAEKQVSLLQNELIALKTKSEDEKSQLKSEISTRTEQLKRKNKILRRQMVWFMPIS